MKNVQDVIERLWDFIDKLDINTFGKFLADNIVGSVVAFSLLFWVPLSILVHCVVGLHGVLACLGSCQSKHRNQNSVLLPVRTADDDSSLCYRTRNWTSSLNRTPSLGSSPV